MGWGSPLRVSEKERDRMGPSHTNQRAETLEYIQEILEQLCLLARQQDCELLGYLIEMATIETGDLLRASQEPSLSADGSRLRR